MRVLVTGGAGYIGSHVCKALAAAGHQLLVYDNLSTGHAEAVRWGPLERGDVRDGARLAETMSAWRPDLVMHFAALAYVGESVQSPSLYYDVNVGGSLSLLKAMLDTQVRRIVFSSTCATYGIPAKLPILETTPQSPVNPYGFTKLVVERALRDWECAYGLEWVALRYFNAAGADPEGEVGEDHEPETHAIPLAIRAAMGLGPAFSMFGSDFDTPDGTAVRDYVHVSDLADAHVAAAQYLESGGGSIALNLGTGRGTSVREIVAAAAAVTGRDVPLHIAPRRAGDPPCLYADAALARAVLGWSPRIESVEDMVATAANWLGRGEAGKAAGRRAA
jgi:UDP-arabinose 4-epimerase